MSSTSIASNNANSKTRHAVAKTSEFPPGSRKIVNVPAFGRDIEIGIFNVHGKLVAYRNVCPHAGAPVCVGRVCSTTLPSDVYEYNLAREGEILRCPWHGWEFDLFTGEHLVDEKMKLRAYDVETQEVATAETATDSTGTPQSSDDQHTSENLESFPIESDGETIFILI
jgi:nitrite reductase/ring-hydroxylating ferredoxin subunit